MAMRTAISSLTLVEPRTLPDALRLLREEGPLTPLAGCTDLYVSANFGTLEPRRFLDVWALDELRPIALRGDLLSIGALATYADIMQSEIVARRLPMLAAAASEIGGVQIQNRGTIGGNIANASPAADSLPVLAAADATIVLVSMDGERRVPVTAFYTGYRATVMRPDELIAAVEIGPVEGRQWFRKVGTRAAQAISKVVMAAVRAPSPRIALGSVAPTVVRAYDAERALASGASLEEAVAAMTAGIAPIDDLRSTAAYRRRVAGNLLRRFWRDTQDAASGG
jgi:CO/xanthine dehydrogenase FAD-binding subunit